MRARCGSIKADLATIGPQPTPENASAFRTDARKAQSGTGLQTHSWRTRHKPMRFASRIVLLQVSLWPSLQGLHTGAHLPENDAVVTGTPDHPGYASIRARHAPDASSR